MDLVLFFFILLDLQWLFPFLLFSLEKLCTELPSNFHKLSTKNKNMSTPAFWVICRKKCIRFSPFSRFPVNGLQITETRAFQMLQAESRLKASHSAFTKFESVSASCRMGSRRMTRCFHLPHCIWECRKELSHQQLSITALSWGHSHLSPIKDNFRLCLQCGVFPSPFFLGVMYNLVKELNILQDLTRNREVSGTESFHTDL